MKETLVFVHGMSHGAWCWEEQFIPYFEAKGYTCLAINLPGHAQEGSSKAIRYSLADYVQALKEVVDELPEAPILIGHSMGGMIVQRYLKTGKAKKAILLASVPPSGVLRPSLRTLFRFPGAIPYLLQGNLFKAFKKYSQLFFNENPLAEVYKPKLCAESFRAYLGLFIPVTHRINCPVLVIGGSADGLISMDEFQQTAKHYQAPIEIMEGGSHDLMLDEGCEKTAALMEGWIAS
jgi:pimeloyl-ACP methyl ester carboxylesterase